MVPTRRKIDGIGDSHYKRFTVIDGPMPRRIDADARESTRHQYWSPQDLRQIVESEETPENRRSLVIALVCFGIVLVGLVWWWL